MRELVATHQLQVEALFLGVFDSMLQAVHIAHGPRRAGNDELSELLDCEPAV